MRIAIVVSHSLAPLSIQLKASRTVTIIKVIIISWLCTRTIHRLSSSKGARVLTIGNTVLHVLAVFKIGFGTLPCRAVGQRKNLFWFHRKMNTFNMSLFQARVRDYHFSRTCSRSFALGYFESPYQIYRTWRIEFCNQVARGSCIR